MLRNGSAQFNIFYGCNSKELYHYLRLTLENASFGNAVIHVGMNNINNRDSSKSLQLLQNLQKLQQNVSHMEQKMCPFLAWFTIKGLMDILWNVLTQKLLIYVSKIITVL